MDSVASEHPIYGEGWREMLENIRDGAITLKSNVIDFGEAFDDRPTGN
jgi:hypothetical protein